MITNNFFYQAMVADGGSSTLYNTEVRQNILKNTRPHQNYLNGFAGRAGNYKINLINGVLQFIKPVYQEPEKTLPINLSLCYDYWNNNLGFMGTNSKLPRRFRTNYHQMIYKEGNEYFYLDGVGLVHYFISSNDSSYYYEETGTGLVLKIATDKLTIEKDNMQVIFAKKIGDNWYLTEIKKQVSETNFASLTIAYDDTDNISSITDGLGKEHHFTYANNEINFTPFQSNKVYSFKMNSNGYLTEVIEPLGRSSTYEYNSLGQLARVKSDNGEQIDFLYDSENRPFEVTESNVVISGTETTTTQLEKYTIVYDYLKTDVTNSKNVLKTYYYSPEGIYSGRKSANSYVYTFDNNFESTQGQINVDKKVVYEYDGNLSFPVNGIIHSEVLLTINASKSNLTIEADKRYVCVVEYSIPMETNGKIYIRSLSSSHGIDLYQGIDYVRTDSFIIDGVAGGVNLEIFLENTNATLNIYSVTLYECIGGDLLVYSKSSYSGLPVLDVTGLTNWSRLSLIQSFTYGSEYTTIEKGLSYQDIITNHKLRALGQNYMWYDNMTKLIVNPGDTVNLSFSHIAYPINMWNLVLGLLERNVNSSRLIYCEYVSSSTSTFNNFAVIEEIIIKGDSYVVNTQVCNKLGQVTQLEDCNGITKTYSYDSQGLLLEVITGNKTDSLYSKIGYYNGNSRVFAIKEYNGSSVYQTSFTYNTCGTINSITLPNGQVINYSYDDLGRNIEVKSINNSLEYKNNKTYSLDKTVQLRHNNFNYDFEYGDYLELSKFKASGNDWFTTEVINGAIGDTNVISFANNFHIEGEYDRFNRLIVSKEKLGSSSFEPVIINQYIEGLSVNTTTPNAELFDTNLTDKLVSRFDCIINNRSDYTYDNQNRITKIQNTNNQYTPEEIETIYNTDGSIFQQIIKVNSQNTQTINTYYEKIGSFPTDMISKQTTTINYAYNGNNEISYVYRDYTRDNFKRILTDKLVSNSYAIQREYLYGNEENIIKKRPNNINYKVGYASNPTTSVGSDYYSYDSKGFVTQYYTFKASGAPDIMTSYTYDTLGRLTSETNPKMGNTTMLYNLGGNIVQKTKGGITYNYTYDYEHKDRLLSYNGYAFTYDAIGNPLSYGSDTSYIWERGNKLKVLTAPNVSNIYTYNADGIRVKKETSAIKYYEYVVLGNKIIKEKIVNGSTVNEINYAYLGDEIVGFAYQNRTYLYRKNIFGDIIEIYDTASNSLKAKYYYDAWGNHQVCDEDDVVNTSETFIGNINPFRYRGYYYDSEANLYYCNSRYYSPEFCRWLNADSYEFLDYDSIGGLNLYTYCLNDPINYVDPSGNSAQINVIATPLLTPVGGIIFQGAVSLISYVGTMIGAIFDENIRNDMDNIKWNPFNANALLVSQSKKVSFYKGMPVIRTNFGSSGSFGIILLTRSSFLGTSGYIWTPDEVLKHEFGHGVQQIILGPIGYLLRIAIPSISKNYDDAPYEITADIFGGVGRTLNPNDVENAWEYLFYGYTFIFR